MALKGKQICTTYKNTWYLNPENHVLNICMTAFTVILKTLPTLSSAMGLFLEDGPTAETALPYSVFGERLDLKAMWPLRTKKDGMFKCLKGILLTLHLYLCCELRDPTYMTVLTHSLILKMSSQI
jgi:hypothetical protein